MGLLETNILMGAILVFAFYITQADRNYFCQKLWSKLWNK